MKQKSNTQTDRHLFLRLVANCTIEIFCALYHVKPLPYHAKMFLLILPTV